MYMYVYKLYIINECSREGLLHLVQNMLIPCLGNIALVLQTVQNHLSSIECVCVHYILSRDVLLFV